MDILWVSLTKEDCFTVFRLFVLEFRRKNMVSLEIRNI